MQKRYPFKFLDAYSKKDTDIFFGRDEEVEALYQMTFQSDILLEIRRLITSQLALKEEARALFTEKQLNLIEPYINKLALEPDALALIRESRAEIRAKTGRVRRRNLLIGAVLALAAVVSIIFAVRANNSAWQAEQNLGLASTALEEAKRSQAAEAVAAQNAKDALLAAQASEEKAKAAQARDSLKAIELNSSLKVAERLKNRALNLQSKADLAQQEIRLIALKAIQVTNLMEEEMKDPNNFEQRDTLESLKNEILAFAGKIDTLIPFQDPYYGSWGYKDALGTIAILPKYNEAFPFENGQARVKEKGIYFYIDKQGKLVDSKDDPWRWIAADGSKKLPDGVVRSDTRPDAYVICRGTTDAIAGKHIGKLQRSQCYFGWGGEEKVTDRFEVLVLDDEFELKWVDSGQSGTNLGNEKRVIGGSNDEGGDPLYVIRSYPEENEEVWIPGKLYRDSYGYPLAHFPYNGKEVTSYKFQYLVVKKKDQSGR